MFLRLLGGRSLRARIEVAATTLTWANLRLGDRELEDLGPFVFDRAQYEAALADAG